MSDRVYDADWYRKKVADPETGEPVRFTGGPLASVDFELDAKFYGVEHENRRLQRDYEVRAACNLIRVLAGTAEPERPGYKPLDTTAWLDDFSILWEPENIPSHLDPANAVNFRLDVLKALAHLPASRRRALIHRMDGFSLDEIADLLGFTRTVEAWTGQMVLEDRGDCYEIVPEMVEIELANPESAERLVRIASSEVRSRSAMDVPGPKGREPRPNPIPTDVIRDMERDVESTRAWRQRELRRRQQQQKEAA